MPTYSYTAIAKTGERVSGSEVAKDESQLSRILQEKGYFLTTARKGGEGRKSFSLNLDSLLRGLQSVSLKDKLMFTRNLQVMVASGIPLPKSLDVLTEQTKNKRFKTTLQSVKKSVVEGKTLSETLKEHPKVFSELFQSMVRVGVLTQLMLQMEQEHELKARVMGALMYPAVIMVAMIGIGALMLMLVVPQLAKVFEELGVDLPLTTRVIIGMGEFMVSFWYIVLPSLVGGLFLLWQFTKTKPGKKVLDTVNLRIPILSGIIRKTNAALMTRTLSALISAGVPIVRALEITSEVVGNWYFQDSLRKTAKEVGKGAKVSETLKLYKHLYPIVVIQMIQVGEETGETGKILAKLAEFFEQEVAAVTKNLTAIIEPILMLVIGGVVGFFAISMVQPMYSMLGALQ
jgi:type IV pilus assembly protein PilC